jgi:uncharacterized protein YbjT (DUF2867 family)
VELLTKRGMPVRVLTRDRTRAKHLPEAVEIVEGNVRDPETLTPAMAGVTSVISAIQGLDDPKSNPMATDRDGNRNLITAAKASGVDHFVLVSVVKSSPDHPMSLGRAKFAAEQSLKASGLAWTIVRGTAYMEFWVQMVVQPLIDKGRTQVFGRGDNPINFVSVNDVAKAVEMAVVDSGMKGVDLEVGGPENFTMNQVVESFERMTGRKGKVSHVPLTMMRIMSVVIRPVKPAMARIVQAGVVMDTSDIMAWEPPADRPRYPWLLYTPLAEAIKTTENTPA